MKRRISVLAGCVLLFAIGGGLGYFLTVPVPAGGGGQYRRSPDEKWVAFANTLDDGPILGPQRTYYEFMIQTVPPSPQTVRRVTIEDTASPAIDWREQGSILWATNSLAVTFTFDGNKESGVEQLTNDSVVNFTNIANKVSLQMTLKIDS